MQHIVSVQIGVWFLIAKAFKLHPSISDLGSFFVASQIHGLPVENDEKSPKFSIMMTECSVKSRTITLGVKQNQCNYLLQIFPLRCNSVIPFSIPHIWTGCHIQLWHTWEPMAFVVNDIKPGVTHQCTIFESKLCRGEGLSVNIDFRSVPHTKLTFVWVLRTFPKSQWLFKCTAILFSNFLLLQQKK